MLHKELDLTTITNERLVPDTAATFRAALCIALTLSTTKAAYAIINYSIHARGRKGIAKSAVKCRAPTPTAVCITPDSTGEYYIIITICVLALVVAEEVDVADRI